MQRQTCGLDEEFSNSDYNSNSEASRVLPLQRTTAADPWTEVTEDIATIKNLMDLYFCWEYRIFAGFSREYFLVDYKASRRRYCSSVLVNAILAVGQQFTGNNGSLAPSDTQLNKFSDEAERLFSIEENRPSLTTIQALGIMSVYEAREGRESRSLFYSNQSIRMAVDMGLHIDNSVTERDEGETGIRAATLWGAFALDM